MRRTTTGLALLLCFGALLACACGDKGDDAPKPECESSEDCPTDNSCIGGRCIGDERPTFCQDHTECPVCNICDMTMEPNICTYDSNACMICAGDADCPEAYTCYLPTTGQGHCIPVAVDGDAEIASCDPNSATACSDITPACPYDMSQKCDSESHMCVCKYRACKDSSDCAASERCDTNKGICIPKS